MALCKLLVNCYLYWSPSSCTWELRCDIIKRYREKIVPLTEVPLISASSETPFPSIKNQYRVQSSGASVVLHWLLFQKWSTNYYDHISSDRSGSIALWHAIFIYADWVFTIFRSDGISRTRKYMFLSDVSFTSPTLSKTWFLFGKAPMENFGSSVKIFLRHFSHFVF